MDGYTDTFCILIVIIKPGFYIHFFSPDYDYKALVPKSHQFTFKYTCSITAHAFFQMRWKFTG